MPDGTIVTVEFGCGTAGAVVYVSPDGGTGTVPGLDVTKRRLGLTLASDGTLYDSYFYKLSAAPPATWPNSTSTRPPRRTS